MNMEKLDRNVRIAGWLVVGAMVNLCIALSLFVLMWIGQA